MVARLGVARACSNGEAWEGCGKGSLLVSWEADADESGLGRGGGTVRCGWLREEKGVFFVDV